VTIRLAYLLPHVPRLSETFITDEIEALERQGAAIELYALLPGRRGVLDPAPRRSVIAASVPRAVAAQLYWLARSPRRMLGIWWVALSRHCGSPKLFARAVLGIASAAVFAIRMRRSGIVHVHAHFATHSALAAWVIERLAGIPYSFTAHADDVFVRRPMLEEKVARASFIVAISEYNRRFLTQQLGDAAGARIRVVHCGVSRDRFAPIPRAECDTPFTILCVGRLEPKKGQRHLIEACHRLAERGIALRCLLVGEGGERARLERARDAAGLGDRVALLGARSREQIRALMAEAHVFALPSVVASDGRADGIPVALMEAMAMERPVVSTPTSGIPELVEDGCSGWLVAPGDPTALADALERIYADPSRAAQVAREGARMVRDRFDLDQSAAQLLRLFGDSRRAPPERLTVAGRIGSQVGFGGAPQ
jgi:colanic acid/amylovoran biosynthesis glycosyltransferase